MPVPEIDLTVYPDECDAFGHLNQASFLTLFERARWEMLARGPGMDVFTRAGSQLGAQLAITGQRGDGGAQGARRVGAHA